MAAGGLVQALNAGLRRVPVAPLYILGVLPALWLFWQALTGGLGPDPVRALEHRYGEIALQLLIAGLVVTPLRRFTGVSLLRFRRALGLLAFAYAVFHVSVWLVLDVQLDMAAAWVDVFERPHITVGAVAVALLVPLALTSTDAALRRLGPQAWRRLHMLVYPAVLGGAIHWMMLAKTWEVGAATHLAVILVLLALRLPWRRKPRSLRDRSLRADGSR
ncbi:protein-methionine-sulfoxide reductase heme-binding subunit MsrQ [Rhodobaculum claviforme]|uniref:Protein-methionine-sulfoxide reductase heme-binding subunit MsrQ n=1 Tax=Rhodobaculum claviforme TaxID=1549854 RepID=A0A934THM6_9RHOB|nr:protein-methionine-sulfoxide reductase heme-binding subunit MsrQ [Rhodobaculum claviforme]MBK5926107.1 sulfoxide reductase heme-binding subunit YedZ [Rhodobaculum claviforme]